jgi:hypothetical protein
MAKTNDVPKQGKRCPWCSEGIDIGCPCPQGRVRDQQEKTWGGKRRDGEVSEKSCGKRVKVAVDSIPKAHTALPDGALASEVQYRGCERTGGMYTTVPQDAKMEILGLMICLARNSVRQEGSGAQNYPP